MKGLNQFRRFDWNGFASDKTFQCINRYESSICTEF